MEWNREFGARNKEGLHGVASGSAGGWDGVAPAFLSGAWGQTGHCLWALSVVTGAYDNPRPLRDACCVILFISVGRHPLVGVISTKGMGSGVLLVRSFPPFPVHHATTWGWPPDEDPGAHAPTEISEGSLGVWGEGNEEQDGDPPDSDLLIVATAA